MTKKLFLLPLLAVLLVGCGGGNGGGSGTGGGGTGGGGGSGESGGGTGGGGGTSGGTEKSITFDFSTAPAGAPTSWTDSATNTFATSVNNYSFSVINGFFAPADTEHGTEPGFSISAKKANAKAMISCVTAIPGAIKNVSFVMPTGSVSANAPYIVEFGSAPISAVTSQTADAGKKGGSGVTVSFDCSVANSTYFAINVVQGVSSSGKATWYNGMIKTLTVTYIG